MTDPPAIGAAEPPRKAGLLQWVEYGGFLLVASLFRALPIDWASGMSGWIWRRVAPNLRRQARAMRNLDASIPGLSLAEKEAILGDMWEMLGRTFAEVFRLDEILADRSRITIEVPPEVQVALDAGNGAVMVSLHMGNWEIAAPCMAILGFPVAGVYQKLKNPLVDRWLTEHRGTHYPLGLFSKGHGGVNAMIRVLRQKGTITLLADLRDHGGLRVPFFGREAPSTPFPAMLARGRDVPLIAGRVQRLKGCHFHVTCEVVPVPRTANRQADILATTAAIHAIFERWIRDTPGQWMWAHRRWG